MPFRTYNTEAVQTSEIRQTVERIRSSQAFSNSSRLVTLLDFVLASTLRPDGASLTEDEIGVALYDNPERCGLVRVQAERLRDRLQEYYATEGASDPVVIRIDTNEMASDRRLEASTVIVARNSTSRNTSGR